MARMALVAVLAAAALVGGLLTVAARAAVKPEQREKIQRAQAAMTKAGNLYKAKKYKESGESVEQAQKLLDELSAADNAKELERGIAPIRKQMTKAHGLLELEGVKLPPLATAASPAKPAVPAAGQVSFTRQVAPLLSGKCGDCHVRRTRGTLSMATFAALSKGNKDGVVIMPGNSKGSRIIEVIESGDMPRGGGKVAADELALLKSWIDQGAKFDGPDPSAPLPAAPAAPKLAVQMATGKETVQFGRDIGPVLLANCMGCHGERNPRGQLRFTTFSGLLQGGMSGQIVVPGKPAESLLVKKLRGKAGDRMPMGRPPLADDVIAKFETWIAEQARFDGPDAGQPLAEVVALVKSINSSHEELSLARAELARKNWRLMLPDVQPVEHQTKDFFLLGNVSQSTVVEVSELAESLQPKLARLLSLPAEQPLVKGRMTLLVFDKRYDYAELGTMLEKRSLPDAWRGHWRYTITDAYGCVVPAKSGEYGLPALVAQQVAGVYVASLGKVPRWFAEGSARAVAAKIDPKDARVRGWGEQVPRILSAGVKPDGFIAGGIPPEDADVLSFSFAKSLMSSAKSYNALLAALRAGTPFDQAFSTAYRANPAQLTGSWYASAAKGRGR